MFFFFSSMSTMNMSEQTLLVLGLLDKSNDVIQIKTKP